MATAMDYKYVYVNYVVTPDDSAETIAIKDSNVFDQFAEILPLHQDHASNEQTIVMSPPFDEAAVAVQYITQNEQISVMTADDQPPSIAEEHFNDPEDQHMTEETNNDSAHKSPEALDTSIDTIKDELSEDEDDDSEQDLTSLAWLSDPNQNYSVNFLAAAVTDDYPSVPEETTEITPTKTPKSKTPLPEAEPIDPKEQLVRDKNLTQERFNKFMVQVQECQQAYAIKEPTYRDNAAEKPPFIYAQMIAMAMVERGRMTLKDIEQWIQERFAYYRCTGNWNNSIRHNLSIHFGFTKIAREKNEKGKGGYWELSMNITKGEKKRVRNRSKRGLANGAGGGAMKRPRRVAAVAKQGTVANRVPAQVNTSANVVEEKSVLSVSAFGGSVTLMSDGYETNCSDGTTSNGYEQDVFVNTSSLLHDGANEIFLGCDIPLSGDCIIIPYTGQSSTSQEHTSTLKHNIIPPSTSPHSSTAGTDSTPASPSFTVNCPADYNNTYLASQLTAHATLIAHGLTNPTFGPNVIVETLPYAAHHQAVLDQVVDIERQFSSMVQLPEPELMAEYDAYFDYSGCSW